MTAYEEHLLLRKQLKLTTWLSRFIVFGLSLLAFAVDLWRIL